MIDVKSVRKDFPMLKEDSKVIYFDNASTSFKPTCVLEEIEKYYKEYTANAHRGDYTLSYEVDVRYEKARETVAKFINANSNEIIFTSGTTESINNIAYNLAINFLHKGDEILLNEQEHASNTLPWYKVAKLVGAKVKFVPLTDDNKITLENFKKALSLKTKIVAINQVSNTVGYINDIKAIANEAHKVGAYVVVDAAQSVTCVKIDVKDLECDFLAFSGHKLCGPTGVGVLYGKEDILNKMEPSTAGGGMNLNYDVTQFIDYKSSPFKYEAGTPKIEGALGLARAIEYLESIGLEEIHKYEKELRAYALDKLKKLDNIEIYNADGDSNVILFNVKGVFPQDSASYFNKYGICVRGGNHCAKLMVGPRIPLCLRASFSFYNTKEEIDYFVEIAKNGSDFLDAYF